jgi:hypothetical protein
LRAVAIGRKLPRWQRCGRTDGRRCTMTQTVSGTASTLRLPARRAGPISESADGSTGGTLAGHGHKQRDRIDTATP